MVSGRQLVTNERQHPTLTNFGAAGSDAYTLTFPIETTPSVLTNGMSRASRSRAIGIQPIRRSFMHASSAHHRPSSNTSRHAVVIAPPCDAVKCSDDGAWSLGRNLMNATVSTGASMVKVVPTERERMTTAIPVRRNVKPLCPCRCAPCRNPVLPGRCSSSSSVHADADRSDSSSLVDLELTDGAGDGDPSTTAVVGRRKGDRIRIET